MQPHQPELTQPEINHLCTAASAVYFEILQTHAHRTGMPVMIPELLCPLGDPPRSLSFDDRTLVEAEQFLLRLGLIAVR